MKENREVSKISLLTTASTMYKQNDVVLAALRSPVIFTVSRSLWSNLSMWGHFLIVLNLRKPNPPSIGLRWLTSIQIEFLRISSLCYRGDIFNAINCVSCWSEAHWLTKAHKPCRPSVSSSLSDSWDTRQDQTRPVKEVAVWAGLSVTSSATACWTPAVWWGWHSTRPRSLGRGCARPG